MKRRSASWSISWLLVCGALQAGAVQIDFQASVDRTRSGQADPIQLTLKITADESLAHVPAPELSLAEFVVEGPVLIDLEQVLELCASVVPLEPKLAKLITDRDRRILQMNTAKQVVFLNKGATQAHNAKYPQQPS